ncbi:hypothetical protein LOTGIDRAFT_200002 [Lottia gigantea]|uniref:Complex 1 LYR protein domain-containing protein n=1 Tax=Lottia gigantea TaxID=225164 RepID=V4B3F2_LOTGI|nr:hypothetical protein LOTGIDRAFT_200002 [Lottia gigantea]ESP01871.1 hypothetical protein LOTGIDRAFT_200002 [Lottia gigantea]
MSASTRSKVLELYRKLLREGKQLSDYNFRFYAQRRVRDAFKENKSVSDPQTIEKLIQKSQTNLEILKRQVLVEKLYGKGKLVIER